MAVLGNGQRHPRVICYSHVGLMLEGAGSGDFDLGTEVNPEEFSEAVRTHKPQLVGLSALLTTTMQNMKSTWGRWRIQAFGAT